MSKNDLIKILSDTQHDYVSGEFLAEKLGVSRTAIWKGINALKADGFDIEAIRNKGYRLSIQNDILNTEIIQKYLTNPGIFKIECYDSVSSTNTILQQRYTENEGLVIVANSQELGMGRINRNFFSPKDTGVYFSLLLKPLIDSDKKNFITSMAGIAVCRAIHSILGLNAKIKWVNDVYIDGKKVCGILTQGSFSFENNKMEYIVLGIGINVYNPINGFPKNIENSAGSVITQKQGELRNRLIAEVLNEFWELYKNFDFNAISSEYKSLNYVIGKEISVISDNSSTPAKVVDIDTNCRLVVQFENGDISCLDSGEISIREVTIHD